MHTVATIFEARDIVQTWRAKGERIALVPTMGNLHAGHLSLVSRAQALADRTVASIFVNPSQFGEHEDFEAYPSTLDQDSAQLSALGCDLLFAPPVGEIYPQDIGSHTQVEVRGLSDMLCGAFRPGHFGGVALVVNKLFNIVAPQVAVFGSKDYQQLLVIRRMVQDLFMPVAIVAVDTVREQDGLAMSSRNQYLSPDERARAPGLYHALCQAAQRLRMGEGDIAVIEAEASAYLEGQGFRLDYCSIRRVADLLPPRPGDEDLVVLAAAWLGGARLIDNVFVAQD